MTRLGGWEFLALVGFWLSGLAAYIIGGLPLVGTVFQVFLVSVFLWIATQLWREYWDDLTEQYRREVIFREWRRGTRLKGMD